MSSKLIVGIGNPGVEYDNTRHNVGFIFLDSFSEKYKISKKRESSLLSWCGKGKLISNTEIYDLVLGWPTTFVNNSGNAIVKLLNWFKIEPSDLIVVHDDVALNLGKIRVSYDSGAGGHHGVESIIQSLGDFKEFTRLRIGIGPDPGGDIRKDYVLTKFAANEEETLNKVINISTNAIETIITKNAYEAMNMFNGVEINNDSITK